MEIVGVSRDAHYRDLRGEIPPTVFLPALQKIEGNAHYLVRVATGDPAALFSAIRAMVREVDGTLPVLNLRTQDEQIDRLHAQEILFARLAGLFGSLALLLASVGLYGLISYMVVRRTREIGVRMALGAIPANVVMLVLREPLLLGAFGVLLCSLAAWGTGRLIVNFLFGLTATDPLTYGIVAGMLLLIAAVAASLPAWRAARINPTVALRYD